MKLIIEFSRKKFSYYIFTLVLILILSLSNSNKVRVNNSDLPTCIMKIANQREISISGGQLESSYWDSDCEVSISIDFSFRDQLEEFKPCKEVNTWGPQPNIYPSVDPKIIPVKCNLNLWQQRRTVALIDKFIFCR